MFNNIFKKLMKMELIDVSDDAIIDVIGSIHEDIFTELKKNGYVDTPWGKYQITSDDNNENIVFNFKLDENIENHVDVPWDAFDSMELKVEPKWVRLETRGDNDIDFKEIFFSAVSVAMGITLYNALSNESGKTTPVSVPVPITSEIGTYVIENGVIEFIPGKSLKQIIKDDK